MGGGGEVRIRGDEEEGWGKGRGRFGQASAKEGVVVCLGSKGQGCLALLTGVKGEGGIRKKKRAKKERSLAVTRKVNGIICSRIVQSPVCGEESRGRGGEGAGTIRKREVQGGTRLVKKTSLRKWGNMGITSKGRGGTR